MVIHSIVFYLFIYLFFRGWCEYMYSPADNCAEGPDRKAHGDLPMLEYVFQR